MVNLHGMPAEAFTYIADGGVESAYMCENCKHGYSVLCVVPFSRIVTHVRDPPTRTRYNHNMCNFDKFLERGLSFVGKSFE
jgi:hypothetical protein